jgi:multidrug efflux pump
VDQALKVLEKRAAEILPPGFAIDYAGESRQLRTEGNTLVTTMILSLILIFLVLAAQFESFRDPAIILLGSVPLALSGALLFNFLGATSINIYSQVGLITLVGLIAKNGILIVEFANNLQEGGLDKWHAILAAAGTRLLLARYLRLSRYRSTACRCAGTGSCGIFSIIYPTRSI